MCIFIHSSVNGHLGCFRVLAVVNSAAVTSGLHVSFSILVSSGYMPAAAAAAKSPQSCPTLCNPMNQSTPDLPVHHQLRVHSDSRPAIPLLGIYPEETKIERDTCIPLFIAALFTIARTWKQPRCPSTDEWIKLWYISVKKTYTGQQAQQKMLKIANH